MRPWTAKFRKFGGGRQNNQRYTVGLQPKQNEKKKLGRDSYVGEIQIQLTTVGQGWAIFPPIQCIPPEAKLPSVMGGVY